MKVYGIDVSAHQGTINWQKVSSELRRVNGGSTPGFAILRIGYTKYAGGLTVDKQFASNAAGCVKYGVPFGVYFYSYDQSAAAATKSAQAVVNALNGYKPEYPVYFDVEYESFNKTCGKAVNTAIIKAAMDVLEGAGYHAGVYCSRDFFLNYTNISELAAYTKWEAAYTGSDTAVVNNHMWQYSSKNALGISGYGSSLDCNVCYVDFPAIIKAAGLNGWVKQTPAVPPAGTTEPPAHSGEENGKASVDWDAPGNDFVVTASKGDRPRLRSALDTVADLQLPIRNL